jgi:hypothetical protein
MAASSNILIGAAIRMPYPIAMAAPDDHRSLARRNKPVSGEVEDYEPEDELDEGPLPQDIERFGGVTVKCPECGTELFDDVALCWKCGFAVHSQPGPNNGLPLWAVFTVVVVILAFAVVSLRVLF